MRRVKKNCCNRTRVFLLRRALLDSCDDEESCIHCLHLKRSSCVRIRVIFDFETIPFLLPPKWSNCTRSSPRRTFRPFRTSSQRSSESRRRRRPRSKSFRITPICRSSRSSSSSASSKLRCPSRRSTLSPSAQRCSDRSLESILVSGRFPTTCYSALQCVRTALKVRDRMLTVVLIQCLHQLQQISSLRFYDAIQSWRLECGIYVSGEDYACKVAS